jgi:hypothetical protein
VTRYRNEAHQGYDTFNPLKAHLTWDNIERPDMDPMDADMGYIFANYQGTRQGLSKFSSMFNSEGFL